MINIHFHPQRSTNRLVHIYVLTAAVFLMTGCHSSPPEEVVDCFAKQDAIYAEHGDPSDVTIAYEHKSQSEMWWYDETGIRFEFIQSVEQAKADECTVIKSNITREQVGLI